MTTAHLRGVFTGNLIPVEGEVFDLGPADLWCVTPDGQVFPAFAGDAHAPSDPAARIAAARHLVLHLATMLPGRERWRRLLAARRILCRLNRIPPAS